MAAENQLSPEEIQKNMNTHNFRTDVAVKNEINAIWKITDMKNNWRMHFGNSGPSNRENSYLTVDNNGKKVKFHFNMFYHRVKEVEEPLPFISRSGFVFVFKPSETPTGDESLMGKLLVEFLDKDGNVWENINLPPLNWLRPNDYDDCDIYFTELNFSTRMLLSDTVLGDSDSLTIRLTFTHIASRTVYYPSAAILHEKASTFTNNILAQQMEALMNDPAHADVQLNVKDGSIKAHKFILSARSSVFKTMFEGGFLERSGIVDIPDISCATMKILLHYIYTGNVHTDWNKNISEFLNGANKYDLPGMVEYCNIMLITLCTEVNAEDLLEIARLHSLEQAIKDLENFLKGAAME